MCPGCGKSLRAERTVRCRNCRTVSSRSLDMCPACGEPLRVEWLRPLLLGAVAIIVVLLALWAGPRLRHAWQSLHPLSVVNTAREIVTEVPGLLLWIPTLTPSLTPSPTPIPTRTPTATPTPTLTPMPTPTRTPPPTETPMPTGTPSPTATRSRTIATRLPATSTSPASTSTPLPSLAAPVLRQPEDGTTYQNKLQIKLSWSASFTLGPDQFFEIVLRFTQQGTEVVRAYIVEDREWTVDTTLYLLADADTNRAYRWRVRAVQRSWDPAGKAVYIPASYSSGEWVFYWQ
jgi:hypothetical protein